MLTQHSQSIRLELIFLYFIFDMPHTVYINLAEYEPAPTLEHLFSQVLKQKSIIFKDKFQVFLHLSHLFRSVRCRLLRCRGAFGGRVLLRPLRSVDVPLYVLASSENLLALCKVLIGVTKWEGCVLNLFRKRKKKPQEGHKRIISSCQTCVRWIDWFDVSHLL